MYLIYFMIHGWLCLYSNIYWQLCYNTYCCTYRYTVNKMITYLSVLGKAGHFYSTLDVIITDYHPPLVTSPLWLASLLPISHPFLTSLQGYANSYKAHQRVWPGAENKGSGDHLLSQLRTIIEDRWHGQTTQKITFAHTRQFNKTALLF